jgi:(1->4)-alpha-D-glucan 1-alpha-D-glucosylmutase
VHPAYEATLSAFIGGALDRADGNLFLEDLRAQAAPIAWFGLLNSITLALLKFTSPGVPDLYQGNELLTLRLVDPDNRAPVDYARCQAALSELRALSAEPRAALFRPGKEDLAKLWVTWRTLTARRAQRALFERGEYIPLEVSGARAAHVIAFARRDTEQPGEIAVVIAGRLCATMGVAQGQLPCGVEVWGDTALDLSPLATAPGAVLFDALDDADHGARPIVLDGPRLLVAAALRGFPGALLLARSLR